MTDLNALLVSTEREKQARLAQRVREDKDKRKSKEKSKRGVATTKSERGITKRVAIQIGFPKVVVGARSAVVVDCVVSVVKVDVAIRCKVFPCSFRLASKRISNLVYLFSDGVFRQQCHTLVGRTRSSVALALNQS